jgi:hypothetical protein
MPAETSFSEKIKNGHVRAQKSAVENNPQKYGTQYGIKNTQRQQKSCKLGGNSMEKRQNNSGKRLATTQLTLSIYILQRFANVKSSGLSLY